MSVYYANILLITIIASIRYVPPVVRAILTLIAVICFAIDMSTKGKGK